MANEQNLKQNQAQTREFFPPPTVGRFMRSEAFHRGIRGPRGSGKSTGCAHELIRRGLEQAPNPRGIAKTRFAVVRNTYRELEDTTLKTWLSDQCFPEEYFGEFNYRRMTHFINYEDREIEVIFRALDKPKDVKKVLSLELTGAWINEAREVPMGIISGLADAVGRFPAQADGGCTWRGIIMDTNSPDTNHWWYNLSEKDTPPKTAWEFFTQPGGLLERGGKFFNNPMAENVENLDPDYYMVRMYGKHLDHVRVYYCNEYGFMVEGRAVHEEYSDPVHCAPEELKPVPGCTIYIGIDFGLTPAASFGQILPNGRWHIFDELVTEHLGTERFAKLLKPKLVRLSNEGYEIQVYGDPAGSQEAQTDQKTPFQILEANGIPAQPAFRNNDPTIRRESLYRILTRMIDGQPGCLVSPSCTMTREGLRGGYHYKKVGVVGEERYQEKPSKNQYSHICEAVEYMVQGAGEGEALINVPVPDVKPPYMGRIAPVRDNHPQGWMV